MLSSGVRQDNTWLVVDPTIGCANDCQYCFLQLYGKARSSGVLELSPVQALDALVSHWAFGPHSVPMVGTETDMFMNRRNADFMLEFLRLYIERGLSNPLAVCTKCRIPDDFIAMATDCSGTELLFYVSYSGLPSEIEPHVNEGHLVDNLVRLSRSGHRPIHLLRPLLPQNTSLDVLRRVFGNVQGRAACTVVRGLNLNAQLQKRAWFWPAVQAAEIDFSRIVSTWPAGWRETLSKALEGMPSHPVFLKNSCAIAYVLGRPEGAGTFGLQQCRSSRCPAAQRAICGKADAERPWPTTQEAARALATIGLDNPVVSDAATRRISIAGSASHEHVACLTQILGRRVEIERIETEHEWGGYVLGYADLELPRELPDVEGGASATGG